MTRSLLATVLFLAAVGGTVFLFLTWHRTPAPAVQAAKMPEDRVVFACRVSEAPDGQEMWGDKGMLEVDRNGKCFLSPYFPLESEKRFWSVGVKRVGGGFEVTCWNMDSKFATGKPDVHSYPVTKIEFKETRRPRW